MAEKKWKLTEFLGFSAMNLVICYVASSLVWLIYLGIGQPSYYVNPRPQDYVNTLTLNILPLSLPPLAVSVIIYGKSEIRLNPLEIFLSSWCISTLEVLAFFYLLVLTWHPRASLRPPYPPLEFVLLGLVTTTLTIVYVVSKRREQTLQQTPQ